MLKLFVYGIFKESKGGLYRIGRESKNVIHSVCPAKAPGELYEDRGGMAMANFKDARFNHPLISGSSNFRADARFCVQTNEQAPDTSFVIGDLITIKDVEIISWIDSIEGFQPGPLVTSWYERLLINVFTKDNAVRAWAYHYLFFERDAYRLIPGGDWV